MTPLHVVIALFIATISAAPSEIVSSSPSSNSSLICYDKPLVEVDGLIVLGDKSADQAEPAYKLQCPMDEIIIRKHSRDVTEKHMRKMFREVLKHLNVTWYKDHQPLVSRENGNLIELYDNNTLCVLYQIGQTDAGHYACIVDYSCLPKKFGEYFEFATGAEFDVIVPDPLPDTKPTITHPPGEFFAERGGSVMFTCNRTVTLSNQRTYWFRSCPFKEKSCVDKFMKAYKESYGMQSVKPMWKFLLEVPDEDYYVVNNITDDKLGYYGCLVDNNRGIDIRYGRLDLIENWYKVHAEQKVDALRPQPRTESKEWIVVSIAAFFVISASIAVCVYTFKRSLELNKKYGAPLISKNLSNQFVGKDIKARQNLPNIEAPDIYNTGKSIDGFISGHFHQATGHLMTQSVCTNLLDKVNPSISSSNSQSDESSSGWGKSMSSSGDNCKAFYTHASHTTATTVPLYDHPPSTGTLRHCSTFVQDACVINPTYGFLRPENDCADWNFPRRNLDKLDMIGEGQFGEVWRYIARRKDGNGDIVAVKQLKNRYGLGDRERLELIAEIEIMKSVNDHPNVIKLLHFCVDEYGPTLLIMEYAENGKLQTYLRGCRIPKNEFESGKSAQTSPSITSKELIKFTYHIAKGMEYIASKGIVHRDLASRNILVSKDKVCKVADFGFARRVSDDCAYERTTANPVPVKWMAPEALVENKFTTKSDVFSLGILIWEIVTLGATPYEQLTSEGVYKKVTTGGRLDRPPHCKDEFFNLMAQCWLHDPVQRPTFKEVACQLERLLMSENDYIELDQYPEHAYYNILNVAEKEVVNLDT